jgi:hypothetical protein
VRIRTWRDAEPIAVALGRLPPRIRERVAHAQWFAGADPVFAGITTYAATTDGRSYRETAHVCYPFHLSHRHRAERVSTVVLPRPQEPWVVVHELGHVLHEALAFDTHDPVPVSAYARTDRWEAFAEAFTAWVCPEVYPWAEGILAEDQRIVALFEELAA